jgi:hypothetical protein
VRALGGGIAVQHRMAYQGEYFVDRYGAKAAERTPPIARMLEMGVPVGAGTDATRVASYNPWVSLYWLATGRTVGGLPLYPEKNRLDRRRALDLWTAAGSWFSGESGKKGRIAVGQLADLAVLSADYFSVPDAEIKAITSVLTLVGGKIVHGSEEFKRSARRRCRSARTGRRSQVWRLLPGNWSRYARPYARLRAFRHARATGCCIACCTRERRERSSARISGAAGCSCWAF